MSQDPRYIFAGLVAEKDVSGVETIRHENQNYRKESQKGLIPCCWDFLLTGKFSSGVGLLSQDSSVKFEW
jgi:hypothetical protein